MDASRTSFNEEARPLPKTSAKKVPGKPGRPKPSTAVSQSIPLSSASDEGISVPPADGDARTRITERAFALYQRRGSHHGQDLQDWLAAEEEILKEQLPGKPAPEVP